MGGDIDDVSAEAVGGQHFNAAACLPDSPELALLLVKSEEILDEPCSTAHPAPLYAVILSCLIVLLLTHSTCRIRFILASMT